MPVLVNGFDGAPFDQRSIIASQRTITTLHKLKLTGAYTAGGDTLDWTNGGVNSAVPPAQSGGIVRIDVCNNGPAAGVLGLGGNYVCIPGLLLTNWLLKIFKTAGTEYSGAYLADVLTDNVILRVDWLR
jgi:hypothetical protein